MNSNRKQTIQNNSTPKKRTLIKSGIVLTVFGLIAKFIGLFYRIPLTNLLGANGIGTYQLIFPVYALLVSVVSSAVPVLVSRNLNSLEDERLKKGFFTESLVYSAVIGLSAGLLLVASAKLLGLLQGRQEVEYGYYVIAPAVFFVSVLSSFRGWFNSELRTFHTALTGVFEQFFKLSGILVCYLTKITGFRAVLIALSGIVLSEFVACLYAFIVFLIRGGRLVRGVVKVPFKAFFQASVPLTVGGLVFPLALFADSILVTRLLTLSGFSYSDAVTEYGIFSGAVGPLINLPQSLAISFAVTMIPVVARHKRERNIQGIKQGETSALKAVLSVSLPSAVALFVVAESVIGFLYPSFSAEQQSRAVFLLKIQVIQIPILSVLQLYGAYLQSLDKGVTSARNMMIAGGIKLALNFTAIKWGIIGIVVANTVCYVVCAVLDIVCSRKLSGKNKFKGGVVLFIASAVMGVAMSLISGAIKNNILSLVLSVLIGASIYVIILWTFKKIGEKLRFRAKNTEEL